MNVALLTPKPLGRDSFRRSRQRFVPDKAGCYVLTTFDGTVLYIGLSVSLCRRMGEHLDTPSKVAPTSLGKAVWLYWLETPETNKVERTWLNMHMLTEGAMPLLNSAYSPTYT